MLPFGVNLLVSGEKRGRCEANLLYVESDFGATGKSFTVFFAR